MTAPEDGLREALLLAVEEVDNAWHVAAMREFRPARLNYPTPEDEEMDADPSLPSLPNHWDMGNAALRSEDAAPQPDPEFGGGLATAHPSPADTSSVAPQSLRDALTTAIAEAWAAQSPETNPWIDDAGQPFASWIAEQVAPFLRAALRSTPAAPRPCPACGRSIDHSWWPVGDDSYGCDAAPEPDPCSHGFSGEPCEVHRHLWAVAEPCRDGEHASCPGRDEDGNECGCLCGHVGETAHSSPAAAPTCCELACYEDPGCACDGCRSYFASFLSERGVTRSEDAAPQPDPIPDHYPHPDGYQRDCRRCVIDAAPQPETQHAPR